MAIKRLQKKLLTRLAPGRKLKQMLQNAPNAKQTLTDGQDTNNCTQKNATDQTSSWSLTISNVTECTKR